MWMCADHLWAWALGRKLLGIGLLLLFYEFVNHVSWPVVYWKKIIGITLSLAEYALLAMWDKE